MIDVMRDRIEIEGLIFIDIQILRMRNRSEMKVREIELGYKVK